MIPSISAPTTVDVKALERLDRFGGVGLVRDMIDLFRLHAPARVADARRGMVAADAMVVKVASHSLKSSAAQLGAAAMRSLCEQIELHATFGDLDAAAPLVTELEGEMTVVSAWLGGVRDALQAQEAA